MIQDLAQWQRWVFTLVTLGNARTMLSFSPGCCSGRDDDGRELQGTQEGLS